LHGPASESGGNQIAMVQGEAARCRTVALGGGCFQNARLLTSLAHTLRDHGFEVLLPRRLSPNDGSISVGQAAIAAALLAGHTSAARLARDFTATKGG
jgi:hydrogenase maturation factor HypF (carbamoyltransferase family)